MDGCRLVGRQVQHSLENKTLFYPLATVALLLLIQSLASDSAFRLKCRSQALNFEYFTTKFCTFVLKNKIYTGPKLAKNPNKNKKVTGIFVANSHCNLINFVQLKCVSNIKF